ncbi:MAG: tripartite tricarboxylate transporter substrate binding protein [Lachnospiraceae bacterium]|jgi:tripartite-type tricarboxylate transporter receptor subunit TctC|nr:tripartite tricarboxylate transporter substrate binding protein [Lachnospiraceae bacterium]
MKRKLFMILVVVMMVAMLGACSKTPQETQGGGSNRETEGVTQGGTQSQGGEQTQAPTGTGEWKPEKDVTFVVGFDAGGTADIPARIVAKYMQKYAGVNVIVSNIVGSGGQVAAKQVMEMDADGYTLLHVPVGYYLQAALGNADFTYEDFTPVTMWCDSWVGLVVRADSPYETYEDFITAVRENPDTIRLGSVSGTLPQLAALEIEKKEEVSFKIVDIGSNNKATELLGSRIDAYIDGVGQVAQYVDSGDFRILMAFSKEGTQIPGFPDLPSAQALGYSDFDYLLQSFGMWMPAGADEQIVRYYADLIKTCSEDPDCIAELNALGYGARSEEPESYAKICESVLNGTKDAVAAIME